MEIRPLRPGDVPALAAMLGAMAPWTYYHVDEAAWQRILRQVSPDELAYVLADGEAPIGYVQFRLGGTFGLSGYVRTLAISPARAGAGLGRKLLAFAEAMILGHGPNVFLLCSSRNEIGQAFYRAIGYVECGRLTSYVLEDEDEVVFRKTVGPIRR